METKKKFKQRMIGQREDNMVSMIYHFRDRMQKIQKVINHDLLIMTGKYPVFVSCAAEGLEKLVRLQREIQVALSVHEAQEPGYTKRVLQRVMRWEDLLESEKKPIDRDVQKHI
jgi:hypothetical protein